MNDNREKQRIVVMANTVLFIECIIISLLLTGTLILSSVCMFIAVDFGKILCMLICVVLLNITPFFIYQLLKSSFVFNIVNSNGIECRRFVRSFKKLKWCDIKDITYVVYAVHGKGTNSTKYVAFSEHILSDNEIGVLPRLAGKNNDISVMMFSKVQLDRILKIAGRTQEIEPDWIRVDYYNTQKIIIKRNDSAI